MLTCCKVLTRSLACFNGTGTVFESVIFVSYVEFVIRRPIILNDLQVSRVKMFTITSEAISVVAALFLIFGNKNFIYLCTSLHMKNHKYCYVEWMSFIRR